MSSKFQIVIVDDETDRARSWERQIGPLLANVNPPDGYSGFSVTVLEKEQAVDLVQCVEKRQAHVRASGDPFDGSIQCALDSINLLLVDYDLQDLSTDRGWSTGLQLTVLARAFTRVQGIALINQFATNSFDLTLRQAAESRADFDIGSEQVANPALWSNVRPSFAPWSWLDGFIKGALRTQGRFEWVKQHLDEPVLRALGLTTEEEGSAGVFVDSAVWRQLGRSDVTFRELASESQFLAVKDRDHIKALDESSARVAMALVSSWFDHWLVPSEDGLIDLPHLASQRPWLLKGFDKEETWRAIGRSELGVSDFDDVVAGCEYQVFPAARTVVDFRKLSALPAAAEPDGFSYDQVPDFVFCENTSSFAPFSESKGFVSDLPGNPQRYVNVESTGEGQFDRHAVSYEPSVRLSL